MGDQRSESSVVSIILLVAVTVIVAATVTVLALGLVEDTDPPPQHAIHYTPYNEDHGVVYGTHLGGDNLDPANVQGARGGAVDSGFAGNDATAGDVYTAYARPGDTVRLVWEKDGRTAAISKYSVPEDATLTHVDWSATDSNPVDSFRSQFLALCDVWGTCGLEWDFSATHIRTTGSTSLGAYARTVPENDGEITVDLHLETNSLGDSGYEITAVDQSNERHVLWCEESQSGGDGIRVPCNSGTAINGTDSKTISVNGEIGALEIFVDPEDPSEEIQIYDLKVSD